MKNEITQLSQLLHQLNKRYRMSQCTECQAMQNFFKNEYVRLKAELESLEQLSAHNNSDCTSNLVQAQHAAGILGMYVMV